MATENQKVYAVHGFRTSSTKKNEPSIVVPDGSPDTRDGELSFEWPLEGGNPYPATVAKLEADI